MWRAAFLDQSHRIGRKKTRFFVPGAGAPRQGSTLGHRGKGLGSPSRATPFAPLLPSERPRCWVLFNSSKNAGLTHQIDQIAVFFWGKWCFKHFKPWDLIFFLCSNEQILAYYPIVIWFWKGLGSVGFPGKGCLTLKPRKHKSSVEIPLLPASERPKNRPGQWNG